MKRSKKDSRNTRIGAAACLHYRMEVLVSDVDDTVRRAGGFMFDRAALGWTVIAIVPPECDLRPLAILGVHVVTIDDELSIDDWPAPTVMVIPTNYHTDSEPMRRRLQVARGHHSQILTWPAGDHRPRPTTAAAMVHHQLSSAAYAFKAHAVIALGLPGALETIEHFQSTATTTVAPPIALAPGMPADSA
ncbi:hypothetical protein ABIA30_003168 [Mycobacterium sp. MAA66]